MNETIQLSKFLCYVLRHRPQAGNITLDTEGWVEITTLLENCKFKHRKIQRAELEQLVANDAKQRYEIRNDRIRACQGHSTNVNLEYESTTPPAKLFHGTLEIWQEQILTEGLERRQRHAVHLSQDWTTAVSVGARRGKPVVLEINSAAMHRDGHKFYQATNGVWLTEKVPPQYIRVTANQTS